MAVSPISERRTKSMRLLVAAAGGPAEWSQRFGSTHSGEVRWAASQVSQWISDKKPKPIGEKLARALEAAQCLPAGALDGADQTTLPTTPAPPLPAGLSLDALAIAKAYDSAPELRPALDAIVKGHKKKR